MSGASAFEQKIAEIERNGYEVVSRSDTEAILRNRSGLTLMVSIDANGEAQVSQVPANPSDSSTGTDAPNWGSLPPSTSEPTLWPSSRRGGGRSWSQIALIGCGGFLFLCVVCALVGQLVGRGDFDNDDNDDYTEAVFRHNDDFSAASEEIAALLTDAEARPVLFRDPDWKSDMREQLLALRVVNQEYHRLQPPERYAEAHRAWLRASECMGDFADEALGALNRESAGDFRRAFGTLRSCGELVRAAGEIFEDARD